MVKFRTCFSKFYSAFSLFVVLTGCLANLFADGLPGEYYITQRWRDLFSAHSPATNPAFITEENYVSTRFAICPTLQGSFVLMEGGVVVPIGLYQSVGYTFLGLSTRGDIEQMQYVSGVWQPTGKVFPDNHTLHIISYAINPIHRLSVGLNLNVSRESNFENPIVGVGADLGLSYRLFRHPVIGDHILGLTLQNAQQLVLKDAYASTFKFTWLAKLWENRIDFGIDFDLKDIFSDAQEFITSGGEEKSIEFDFNARLGFWILRLFNIYFQAGSNYWGVTPGFNLPTVNNGRDFQLAYQYMSIVDEVDLTSSHTIYFRGDFGKHREEIYARKMARLASVGPADLYNRARTLYAQGKYWDAFFIFGKILVEYPDFFKNDWVQLHLGLCQENMDMREFSAENFNETKKAYPRSVVVPYADLGTMRLQFREGNSSGVANQFSKLNNSSVPDSLKFHAYYYMGEQHIRDGEFQKAIQILSLVPEDHPEYLFAQHSLAVAYALADNLSRSVEVLDNVIQTPPKNKSQEEIINRSFVFLGYIFYEGLGGQDRALSKAISALRKVPATSLYYEDALLGIAWTALNASQWADCFAACDQLIATTKKTAISCEAMLLKGYCFIMDKKYVEAVNVLTPAYEKINKATAPSEDEKNAAKLEYDNNRGSYYEIASKANELAMTSQSSFVLQQIDSLHTPQMADEQKLRDFYLYSDEFGRRSFFARNIDNVRNDLEYALAKAEKLAGSSSINKTIDKANKESQAIDEDLEKLKKQLEELQQTE